MNKKQLVLILGSFAIASGAFAVSNNSLINRAARSQEQENRATISSPSGLRPIPEEIRSAERLYRRPENPSTQAGDQTVPPHIVYGHVFRHLKELNERANEEERRGRSGAHLRTLYRRMARLDDQRASILDRIVAETNAEVERVDRRAIRIIRQIRARHPDGRLAAGEQLPTPPAELRQLSEERNNLILQGRDRLRSELGEEGFRQFDEFVQQRVRPGIRRLDQPQGQ